MAAPAACHSSPTSQKAAAEQVVPFALCNAATRLARFTRRLRSFAGRAGVFQKQVFSEHVIPLSPSVEFRVFFLATA
jgi:hypothetical protein